MFFETAFEEREREKRQRKRWADDELFLKVALERRRRRNTMQNIIKIKNNNNDEEEEETRTRIITCRVCSEKASKYTCPKCNCRYCSADCYRAHGEKCVTEFHVESLNRMMKNEKVDDGDEKKKREMEEMMREYERQLEMDEREIAFAEGNGASSRLLRRDDDEDDEYDDEFTDEEEDDDEDDEEHCNLSAKLMRAYLKEGDDDANISEHHFTENDKKRLERMLQNGEIRVEPWQAWWMIDDDDDDDDDNNNNNKERKPSLLLREDGTAKIVTINDDDKDDASKKHPKSFPSPPKTPLPSYLSLLPKNKTIVSAKQRNVFRDTVAYAITLYAIISRAFNGDHICFDAAMSYLMNRDGEDDDVHHAQTREEEEEEEEETNDSINALVSIRVSTVINKHTLFPTGLFYDTSKSGKIAEKLESDAYAILRERSKRVLAMEDLRLMFQKAIEESYLLNDVKEENYTTKKDVMKQFRSKCRKMERKLFFAECFANTRDEEFFGAPKPPPPTTTTTSENQLLIKEATYPKEIQLTTSTEYNKIVSNAYAFDSASEHICFDVRSHLGGHVFDGDRIEVVNVHTKEIKTVLQTVNEAKCGVALYHPTDRNVLCCIVGPQHPTKEWDYAPHHRRGYVVDLKDSQEKQISRQSSNLEARDLISPFTKGALRGGTHVHAFSPDGALVSMTYEDAILADNKDANVSKLNARNIAVTIYKDIVRIEKSRNDRNVSGGFTVCVTETTPEPVWGSDEISRAYEDCWMDSRTLSFLGDCRDDRGNLVTELFVVELPEDTEMLKEEEEEEEKKGERLLQGTLTSYPKPPKSVQQRRVTRSSGCQGSVRFWPRANPTDGNTICILLRDDKNSFQLHLVDSTTGTIEQLSSLKEKEEVNSAFSWSPDGSFICFATSKNRIARTFAKGERKGQTEYLTPPMRTTDDDAIRSECVCISPNGKLVCFVKTVGKDDVNQIFVLELLRDVRRRRRE